MTVAAIAEDLRAEQDALDEVVAPLDDTQWRASTPAPGWATADAIGHLTYFDGTAVLAITDPDAFRASMEQLVGSDDWSTITLGRDRSPAEHVAAWRAGRIALAAAAATLDEGQRVPWYGPSMGAKSFLTARLMECWAHGQDIVDAVGGERPASDRLRHIAQLGVITRGWSYVNRGLTAPEGDVRVELRAPSADTWTWGPDDAPAAVRGDALDFCLVVTQRRHVDDTGLVCDGDTARDWMLKAQAFAGGPTDGPAPRTR